jgi:hypothetical protein
VDLVTAATREGFYSRNVAFADFIRQSISAVRTAFTRRYSNSVSRSCALVNVAAFSLLLASQSASAQVPAGPKGMYSGGNEMIQYSRHIRARSLSGTVVDQSGGTVAAARIQVQRQGSDGLVADITADENGRFRLAKLEPGAYWLGISKYGFQLHVWDWRIVRLGWSKALNPKLLVGT